MSSASDQPSAPAALHAPPQPPKLLHRMRDHLRTQHYSVRTETAYLDRVRRFILFHDKRHPAEMGAAEVVQAKAPKRLPVALTPIEVRELLMHMQGTTGLAARLLYGTGMRLLE